MILPSFYYFRSTYILDYTSLYHTPIDLAVAHSSLIVLQKTSYPENPGQISLANNLDTW